MPHYVVKLAEDKYVEWSTIVDAPITYIMDRETVLDNYDHDRIERADKNGTSCHFKITVDDLIGYNRAGPNETQLTREEIIKQYTYPPQG